MNLAVAAAKRAFPEWANSSVETRMAALNDLSLALKELTEELAQTITAEVGDADWLQPYGNGWNSSCSCKILCENA